MLTQSAEDEPDVIHEILHHFREFSHLCPNEALGMFKETVSEWVNDKAPRLGASLAFYTLLSLAPLLVVIVAVAAFVYGPEAARGQLVWQIQGLVGPDGARAIQGLVQGAYKPGTGVIATLLGFLTLVFGASSVVVELRDALNTIWHVPLDCFNTGLSSIFRLVKERFYSFAMILGVGFLLLVSLVLNAWIAAMGKFFASALPTPESLLHVATFLISFVVSTFLFAAIYKMLPDVRLEWSDVAVGASVTSLLFTIGKQLIGLYLGKTSFGSTYGAAGSLVIVLVWVYYSAQLFFLGAEFTKVYTKTLGSHFASQFKRVIAKPRNVIVDPSTNVSTTGTRKGNMAGSMLHIFTRTKT
jgi:membrane protein